MHYLEKLTLLTTLQLTFLHSYIPYNMNLLTKLILHTITTIAIALILLTLLTPLNVLIVRLLTKLKSITYNTDITITLQHEILRGAKK